MCPHMALRITGGDEMRFVIGLLMCASGWTAAQNYPLKPVRLLVGFAPGSTTDVIARTYGYKLSESLGQQMVIENRPGAGANIAAELVAKSAPDGYTLLVGSPGLAVSPALYTRLGYDALKDLTPIGQVSATPHMLVVNPALPVKTLRDFINLARSKPGEISYSSAGAGGSDHLGTELFSAMVGLKMVHVPYKGGPHAIGDVVSGRVVMYFAGMPVGLPLYKPGRVKALAVSSPQRLTYVPELPTMAESGLAGFEHALWSTLMAPGGTPREIVMRLNAELVKAGATRDLRERLAAVGAEAIVTSPEQMAAFLKSETDKYGKIVRALGLRAE